MNFILGFIVYEGKACVMFDAAISIESPAPPSSQVHHGLLLHRQSLLPEVSRALNMLGRHVGAESGGRREGFPQSFRQRSAGSIF